MSSILQIHIFLSPHCCNLTLGPHFLSPSHWIGLSNDLLAPYIALLQCACHIPSRVIVFLPCLTDFIIYITAWRIKSKFFLITNKALTLILVLSRSPSQAELLCTCRSPNTPCCFTFGHTELSISNIFPKYLCIS